MNNQPNTAFSAGQFRIEYISIDSLIPSEYNPRTWDDQAKEQLKESIRRFGLVDPFIVNCAPERKNILIGGHFRMAAAKELGIKTAPVVYVNISDIDKEKELNLRLNRNTGEFDWSLLADFGEVMLADIGFTSEELDKVFEIEDTPEEFDLAKELKKLDINGITVQKQDVYQLGDHRLMCGDSTIEADVLKLMNGEQAHMCLTDSPYILEYTKGKSRGKDGATTGFGIKKNRRYLETDFLPPDFTEKWMANVARVAKPDFSIIAFEHPKNLRIMWNELEKHWKYRNTIVWHLPNRVQGFSAKYKFFNKHDIALVGTGGEVSINLEPEEELFQQEYENALFATSGHPQFESYEKGKKYCPTDFIEFVAADEKSSGQGIIFGTKPIEILIPYMKVLTQRGDIVIETFGGSGSTLITAEKLGRRCYLMEKVPTYAQVIINRWEKLTGRKAEKK